VVFDPRRCELTYSGLAWCLIYVMGMWIAWQGTSCMDWDCGWIGKVPGVWNRLWLVSGVRHGNVDGLERYHVYRMGMWIVWKGSWSTVWVGRFPTCGMGLWMVWKGTSCTKLECGLFGKVPRVQFCL
jgi:hypothetical protein